MGSPKRLFSVVLTTLLSATAFAQAIPADPQPYCLALRGNGENEPAHWGALANLIERAGLPQAQAGGSSATYSMLLVESIAANAWVSEARGREQASRASLLMKSLSGVAGYVYQRPQVQAALEMLKTYKDVKAFVAKPSWSTLKEIASANSPRQFYHRSAEVVQLVKDLMSLGVANTKYAVLLGDLVHLRNLSLRRFKEVKFYASDLQSAVAAFGGFNAESDKNLFFREGLIDFKKFGLGIGRIATFLEGSASSDGTKAAMTRFTDLCEPLHANLTWQELVAQEPRCQQYLNEALASFFNQNLNFTETNVALRPVGFQIPTLATTAVLTGEGYSAAEKTMREYRENLDRTAVDRFTITNPADLRLGYWGRAETLAAAQRNLSVPFRDEFGRSYDFTADRKSQRFLALGSVPWSEVFRLSPAEPGLAALQPMTADGKNAYSAGGWSDLHPVQVLKAAGCSQVIYVTRRGGESLFGQGVAKRLMNLERDWSLLRTIAAPDIVSHNHEVNDTGDATDLTSAWSALYNIGNPRSSFNTALAHADAVLCTDWDRYDVKSQFFDMVIEGYRAPFFIGASSLRSSLMTNGARMADGIAVTTPLQWAGCRAP